MDLVQVAMICHETNKAYCESIGDSSQKSWNLAEQWQRDSAINGVRFAIENPDASASAQHEVWMDAKFADGWVYGPVKDATKKQHPCLVPYLDLPVEQRIKDYLFKAVVSAFYRADQEENKPL
jgi:hypothetical protein